MSADMRYEKLPLWRGVQDSAGGQKFFPFSLGRDPRGFIRQTTPEEVRRQVVASYAADDYTFITQPPGTSEWSDQRGEAYASFIQKVCGPLRGRSVLEIGAANLYMAEKLTRESGVGQYSVIDPALRQISPGSAIRVTRAYFDEHSCAGEDYDVVISLNCLEHVPDPVPFLWRIRRVLARKRGKAVLVFPDNEKQFRRGDLNAILHEHMTYFTEQTCRRLFRGTGFQILESASLEDTFFFCVGVDPSFDYPKPNFEMAPADTLIEEASIGFAANIKRAGENIGDALRQGPTVAFHGATNGLNNLLSLAGLEDEVSLVVFDGDKSKEGKHLPSCRWPIRHAEDPSYKTVDKIFVSAMTFYEPIRRFAMTRHGLLADSIEPLFVDTREPLDATRA